jgi:tRNA G26 N,N-dimethylase Trm1
MSSTAIREGAACIVSVGEGVFFSPIQTLQRDLTVATITSVFKQKRNLHILDAFAGCGIRAIRYALEIDHVERVVANDISTEGVESIKMNWNESSVGQRNHALSSSSHPKTIFQVENQDTNILLASSKNEFDVIDLDPCGSPSHYLQNAIQALKTGGLLCIACTDFKDITGANGMEGGHRTYARYGSWVGGGMDKHGGTEDAFASEVAIRVVLNALCVSAGRVNRRIECVLCASLSFFIRICVRVYDDFESQPIPFYHPIIVTKHKTISFNNLKTSNDYSGEFQVLEF